MDKPRKITVRTNKDGITEVLDTEGKVIPLIRECTIVCTPYGNEAHVIFYEPIVEVEAKVVENVYEFLPVGENYKRKDADTA